MTVSIKVLLSVFTGIFVTSCATNDHGSTAYYQKFAGTYAIDAKGQRHSSKDYRGAPPWLNDLVQSVAPEYRYAERAARHQGRGFFQIKLNGDGSVATVTVAKSTGFKALDDSAVGAFRKWRWKAGRWKEIDVPVTFVLRKRTELPPGAVRLPP